MELKRIKEGMRVKLTSHNGMDSADNLEIGTKGTVILTGGGDGLNVLVRWDSFEICSEWWVSHRNISNLRPKTLENK